MYVAMILYSYGYLSKILICMTILNLIFLNGLLALRWKNKDIFLFFFFFLPDSSRKQEEWEWEMEIILITRNIYIYLFVVKQHKDEDACLTSMCVGAEVLGQASQR